MTEIIAGKRQSGRSTALIKKSAETGIYILVANRKRAEHLALLARDLGYDIPFPVTLRDYFRSKFTGSCIRRDGIFIDDVDDVVEELFYPIEIKAVTFLYDAESKAVNDMDLGEIISKVLEKDESKVMLAPLSNIAGADIKFIKGYGTIKINVPADVADDLTNCSGKYVGGLLLIDR